MASALERTTPGATSRVVDTWNRKLHIYVGLCALAFLWLFAFSGLILNHSQWKFAEFWEQRKQTAYQRSILLPPGPFSLARAQSLVAQLGLSGELEWDAGKQNPSHMEFRVSRPGEFFEVNADLDKRIAAVKQVQLNVWGKLNALHHMKLVDPANPEHPRIWIWTKVWGLAVDALSAGVIFLTLSGVYMWRGRRRKLGGTIAISLGILCCAAFLIRF